ncbi:Uncharacterised protein [Chlamydia abortus]|nr:Uncharacterised protein [Chlamydia abortus]
MARALPLAEGVQEAAACRAGSLRALEDAAARQGAAAGIRACLKRGSRGG